MGSLAFAAIANVPAIITRSENSTASVRGTQRLVASGLMCTPFDVVNAEHSTRPNLSTPNELLSTFVEVSVHSIDIREGYTLVISGRGYPIRAVEDWTWDRHTKTKKLIVEDLKR